MILIVIDNFRNVQSQFIGPPFFCALKIKLRITAKNRIKLWVRQEDVSVRPTLLLLCVCALFPLVSGFVDGVLGPLLAAEGAMARGMMVSPGRCLEFSKTFVQIIGGSTSKGCTRINTFSLH